VKQAINAFGKIDILVNDAGIFPTGLLETLSIDAPSNNLRAIRPADIDPRFNWGRHLPALGTMAVDFEERVNYRRLSCRSRRGIDVDGLPKFSPGDHDMTNATQKLGWIGVGRMGGPMAERLPYCGPFPRNLESHQGKSGSFRQTWSSSR
jgi:hypothetical protein